MSKNRMFTRFLINSILIFTSALIVAGCSTYTMYNSSSNENKKPTMELLEAYQNINLDIQAANDPNVELTKNIKVTAQGFSFNFVRPGEENKESLTYKECESLNVKTWSDYYNVMCTSNSGNSWWILSLKSYNTAQNLVDAIMAMKYYASNGAFDDTQAFVDFQKNAEAWLALSQKPVLSDEVHRYRVLGDDAVANKDFYKAASYYEKGLDIDPLWPAGQYNAAMICAELKFYQLAVAHLKRYLLLKPDDTKKYQDKLYIWEEKANENSASSDNSSNQLDQAH